MWTLHQNRVLFQFGPIRYICGRNCAGRRYLAEGGKVSGPGRPTKKQTSKRDEGVVLVKLEQRGVEDKYVVRREHYCFGQAIWWSASRPYSRRSKLYSVLRTRAQTARLLVGSKPNGVSFVNDGGKETRVGIKSRVKHIHMHKILVFVCDSIGCGFVLLTVCIHREFAWNMTSAAR